MTTTAIYRCTRKSIYPAGTPTSAMQGHYLKAKSSHEARAEMAQTYPGEFFHVELWFPVEAERTEKGDSK